MGEKFSDEAIEAMNEFGEVLQKIHSRLVSEGVEVQVDEHYVSGRNETDMQKPLN